MGKVTPQKQAFWTLEVNDVDIALFQTVSIGGITVDTAEHTEGALKIETPSLVSYADLKLGKLLNMLETDTYFDDWLKSVQDVQAGTGGVPADYARTVRLRLEDNANSAKRIYEFKGCFPKEIGGIDLDKTSSDNITEEITLYVEYYTRIL